jgi:hypothetical protein
MNNETWNECFSQYRLLGGLTQAMLRKWAADFLVERGFDEIGSSDINHSLFGMWEAAGGDWQKAILCEVDARS